MSGVGMHVARRIDFGAGTGDGLGDRLFVEDATGQRRFRAGHALRPVARTDHGDAGERDGTCRIEAQAQRQSGDGEAMRAVADLEKATPFVPVCTFDGDGFQHLVCLDRRFQDPEKKLARRHDTAPARSDDAHLGVQRQGCGRRFAERIAVGQAAADGAPVAVRLAADVGQCVCQ